MWLTVLASQPSVSMATETTQRMCSPSLPLLPMVFIASRSRSASVSLSTSAPGIVLLVAAVEAAQRALKHLRHHPALRPGARIPRLERAALGQRWLDVVPKLQVDQFLAGSVVVHWDSGDLDNAGLDRVYQREVADHPGEDEPFVVAGALQVVRRRGQVIDGLEAGLSTQVAQPAEPDPSVPVAFPVFAVRVSVGVHELVLGAAVVLVVV